MNEKIDVVIKKTLRDILTLVEEFEDNFEVSDDLVVKLNNALETAKRIREELNAKFGAEVVDGFVKNNDHLVKQINEKFDNIISKNKKETERLSLEINSIANKKKIALYVR